jgi:esterase/lipase superfamily enzyme
VLWGKGVWHALRIWDGFAHDWPVWQEMLRLYIGGHD